jgi:two-component system, chemotaxis family, response regulator Rcp1
MAHTPRAEPIDILLVEDNPGDILLVEKAFEKAHLRNNLHVARSGAEAVDFLFRRGEHAGRDEIDLILLDLQLGDRSGLEVLEEIKADPDLKRTPVVVLTSSEAEEDIISSYDRYANAYITKPVDFAGLLKVVQEIDDFWLSLVRFAPHSD